MPPTISAVDAHPVKEFYVHMITKDIQTDEAILDLVDNSVDAAMRQLDVSAGQSDTNDFTGKAIDLRLSREAFDIRDNCGGMSLNTAQNRAFHMGRPPATTDDSDESTIGIYGIGLKRAIFRLGRKAVVESRHETEHFRVHVDSEEWLDTDEWTFPITPNADTDLSEDGVRVAVSDLNAGIGDRFDDTTVISALRKQMGDIYALFIRRGLVIRVNDMPVKDRVPTIDFLPNFEPIFIEYQDDAHPDLHVSIRAGVSKIGRDEESKPRSTEETRMSGWHVACNDRFVLNGDKTSLTGWGLNEGGFKSPFFHNQYNGFVGLVQFTSKQPALLPWTTDKQGLDTDNDAYQRALTRMREATRQFTTYTNEAKANGTKPETPAAADKPSPSVDITSVSKPNPSLRLPPPKRKTTKSIQYEKETALIQRVAKALGLRARASGAQVGNATFDYVVNAEGIDEGV